MDENIATFTIKFTGSRAKEIADLFAGYFWDGGLDQTIDEMFLQNHGLKIEDMTMDGLYTCILNTNRHRKEPKIPPVRR